MDINKVLLFLFFLTFYSVQKSHSQSDLRLQINVLTEDTGPVLSETAVITEMDLVNDVFNQYGINFEYCIRFVEQLPGQAPNNYMVLNVPDPGASFPQVCAGLGNGITQVAPQFFGVSVLCHELGHCLGLPHTFFTAAGQGGISILADDPYELVLGEDPDATGNWGPSGNMDITDTSGDWNINPSQNIGHWSGTHLIGDCGPAHIGICSEIPGSPGTPDDIPCPSPGIFFASNVPELNGEKAPFGPSTGSTNATNVVSVSLDNACNTTEILWNSIALILDSECSTHAEQVLAVQNRGAVAAIICEDTPGAFTGNGSDVDISSIMLTTAQCLQIDANFAGFGVVKVTDCVSPHVVPLLFNLSDCSDFPIELNDDPDNLFSFYMFDDLVNPITTYPAFNGHKNYMSYFGLGFMGSDGPCDLEFTPDQAAILQAWAANRSAAQSQHPSSGNPAPNTESIYLDFIVGSGYSGFLPEGKTYIIEGNLEVEGDLVFSGSEILFTKASSSITVKAGGSLKFDNCTIKKTNDSGLCNCTNYEAGRFSILGEDNSSIFILESQFSEGQLMGDGGYVIIEESTILNSNINLSNIDGYLLLSSFLDSVTQSLKNCWGAYIIGTSIESGSTLYINSGNCRMASNFFRNMPLTLDNTNVVFNYTYSDPSVILGHSPIIDLGGSHLFLRQDIITYNGSEPAISGGFDGLVIRGCDLINNHDATWVDISGSELIAVFNFIESGSQDGFRLEGGEALVLRNSFVGGETGVNFQGCSQSEIFCNSFSGCDIGILADNGIGDQGENDQSAGNRFDGNGVDVMIDPGNIEYFVNGPADTPNSNSEGIDVMDADKVCGANSIRSSFRCGLRLLARSEDCPGGLPHWVINYFKKRWGAACIKVIDCPVLPDPCDQLNWINHWADNSEEEDDHPCNDGWGTVVEDDEDYDEGGEDNGASEFDDGGMFANNNSTEIDDYVIYPNPTDGDFTLELDIKDQNLESYELRIYSIHGKLLKSIESSQAKMSISTNQFDAGLYIIKVAKDGKLMKSKKLMISK